MYVSRFKFFAIGGLTDEQKAIMLDSFEIDEDEDEDEEEDYEDEENDEN